MSMRRWGQGQYHHMSTRMEMETGLPCECEDEDENRDRDRDETTTQRSTTRLVPPLLNNVVYILLLYVSLKQ